MLPNRVPLLSADRPTVAANFLASTSIPSWLTHSRAGGAMQYDSTGKLTWAPENILPYSNTFSSGWATLSTGTYVIDGTNYADPDGGTSATQLTWSGAGNAYIGQSITAGRSDGAP